MLDKRDLKEFYTQISLVDSIFSTIAKTNQKLEKNIAVPNKDKSLLLPNEKDNPALKYINRHVSNFTIREAIAELFGIMIKFDFSQNSSIPNHRNSSNDTQQYKAIGKINLHNHTINVVIEAINVCADEPSANRDLVILMAMLHDFGKCAKLVENYSLSTASPHEVNSSRLAEILLLKFKFHSTLINTVISTLKNHHTYPTEQAGHLMKLLNASDAGAREKEVAFFSSNEKELS